MTSGGHCVAHDKFVLPCLPIYWFGWDVEADVAELWIMFRRFGE